MKTTGLSSLQPVITVTEARKLLGKESRPLDDTQILEIITFLTLLARNYLRPNGSKKQ